MKKLLLFVLLAASFNAQSQKLKDLLYGGKLKLDSNTVIRKGDDLSTKIDTTTKKPAEVIKATTVPAQQTTVQKTQVTTDDNNTAVATTTVEAGTETAAINEPAAAPVKSNSKLWKEYIDSFSTAAKSELASLKKIKKGDYFITVQYEIGLDGQTNILSVVSDPENSLMQSEVKNRLELSAPKLAPVVDSGGKVRKVKRTSNFTITKD